VTGEARRTVNPLRTALAAQGIHLSALFYAIFEKTRLPGTPRRQPRLMAPPGPSTGGGKMSRQNLTLVPEDDTDARSVVIGWADSSTGRAELRSWEVVSEGYQQRFNRPLDIPKGAYNKFVDQACGFFREQGIQVDRVTKPSVPPPQDTQPRTNAWFLWSLVLVLTLTLGVGLGILVTMLIGLPVRP
jgi:hypothetical protein